jgi:hypothetical protein
MGGVGLRFSRKVLARNLLNGNRYQEYCFGKMGRE